MVTKKFPKSKLTNLWFVYWKNAKIKLIKSHLEIKPIGNEDQDTNKGQRPRMSARNRWLIILNRLKENWVPKKPKTSTTNWSSVVNPKPEVDNHLGEPMVWVLSFINVNVILTSTLTSTLFNYLIPLDNEIFKKLLILARKFKDVKYFGPKIQFSLILKVEIMNDVKSLKKGNELRWISKGSKTTSKSFWNVKPWTKWTDPWLMDHA